VATSALPKCSRWLLGNYFPVKYTTVIALVTPPHSVEPNETSIRSECEISLYGDEDKHLEYSTNPNRTQVMFQNTQF